MNSERILFAVADFVPLVGGISHHLHEIVRHLPPQRVRVVGLPTPGWEAFDVRQKFGIRRLRLPSAWGPDSPQFKFLAPFYAFELAGEPKADVILCGQAHHSLMLPAWVMWRTRGTPYGVFTYGTDLLRPQGRPYRRWFNELLRASAVVFSDSRAAAEEVLRLGVSSDKVHLIHPPVDPGRLNADTACATVDQLKASGKRLILTVGRLVERKGQDTVIRAMPDVLRAVPTAHYLVVGAGGGSEQNLRALVADLGMEGHVTFAGYVPDDQLGAYYDACDVFVMTSRDMPSGDMEGFGIVYLEANLFGKPVVAGRSGGVEDAVIHEYSGLLVDPHHPIEVAYAIVRILNDPTLAVRLGETGKLRAVTEFGGGAAAERLLAVLPKKGKD